jgi:hypothetical protein
MVYAGVAVAFLFVIAIMLIIGMMREVLILRGEIASITQLIKDPPAPSIVSGPLPSRLAQQLEDVLMVGRRTVVAFASPGCGPCTVMLDNLRDALHQGDMDAQGVVVIMASERGRPDLESAQGLPHVIHDLDGKLAHVCEVRTTPTAFVVGGEDGTVLDYSFGGSIEWMKSKLAAGRPEPARA